MSVGFLVQEKNQKINFQDGGHLGLPIRIILVFDLLVAPMLPIKFQDNQPFVTGEKAKKKYFQDGGHLGLPIGMICSYF